MPLGDNIIKKLRILRSLPSTIYFNLKYFDLKTAIKLPVILYKPKLKKLGGKIKLVGPVRPGMVQLGFPAVSVYPNSGITWECSGSVTFSDGTFIGNASAISVGQNGSLCMGSKFTATAALRLVCYNNVTFGDKVLVGWDNLVTDTDFHSFKLNGVRKKSIGNVIVGNNVWLAMKTTVLKNTVIPDNCVVGANSLLNKDFSGTSGTLIGGNPAKIIKENVSFDIEDCAPEGK